MINIFNDKFGFNESNKSQPKMEKFVIYFSSIFILLFLLIALYLPFKTSIQILFIKIFSRAANCTTNCFTISGVVTHTDLAGNPIFVGDNKSAGIELIDTSAHSFDTAMIGSDGKFSFTEKAGDNYALVAMIPGVILTSSNPITISSLSGNYSTANFTVKNNSNQFPTVNLNFQSFGFTDHLQMADFDPVNKRVIYYAWGPNALAAGNPTPTPPEGLIKIFNNTDLSFSNPNNFSSYDLTQLVSPHTIGRGGGFLDNYTNPHYAYSPPRGYDGRRSGFPGTTGESTMVQIDLTQKDLGSSNAYKSIDLATINNPPPHYGWFPGVFLNNNAYFVPDTDDQAGKVPHGVFIKYDASNNSTDPNAFTKGTNWSWIDLPTSTLNTMSNGHSVQTVFGQAVSGFQSVAALGSYVYLIPDAGVARVVRYDTTKPFTVGSSYDVFDISQVYTPAPGATNFVGYFTGAMVVKNRYIVMVPWLVAGTDARAPVAAIYDTQKDFYNNNSDSSKSYNFFDISTANPLASGYQYGWVDKDGYVWFVPDGNFSAKDTTYNLTTFSPPFIAWNSNLGFNSFSDPSAWNIYPSFNKSGMNNYGDSSIEGTSTGAAYDPSTNTAYTSPYDGNATQIQITSPNTNKVGDLNNDSVIDLIDLSVLLSNFNQPVTTSNSKADLNGDNQINAADYAALVQILKSNDILF